MRTVRISASGAGKSHKALLGTRIAPCDAILEDFVTFKHPSYLQPEKQMQMVDAYILTVHCDIDDL